MKIDKAIKRVVSILEGIIRNKAIEWNGFWEVIFLNKKPQQSKNTKFKDNNNRTEKSVKEAAVAKHVHNISQWL